MEKLVLLLANSRKLSGRCIAGIEIIDNRPAGWIRPVSSRPNEEISEYERRYADGTDPRVLDIVSIPLLKPRPVTYQSENWILDGTRTWKMKGRADWYTLAGFQDTEATLWIDGYSTFHGTNDKIPIASAEQLSRSLRLLKIDQLEIRVFAPSKAFDNPKRRVQGVFAYNGTNYGLWVTDPTIERQYLALDDGVYRIGEAYVTISLGEPHEGFAYKLIAAVIKRP